MRWHSLAIGVILAVLGAAPAVAHEPCSNCLGGFFERPFTSYREWRGWPAFYYRGTYRHPSYRYVVLRPCRPCW